MSGRRERHRANRFQRNWNILSSVPAWNYSWNLMEPSQKWHPDTQDNVYLYIYNLILKSLTQNSGRERTENHQNRKQIKLSCRNSNLFFLQVFSSCYLENSNGNIQFPGKKIQYQPMFHLIILQRTICILHIKGIPTIKKPSMLRWHASAFIMYTNDTLISQLKRFSVLVAENSHWFNITDKEQMRLFGSLI